MKKFWQRVPKLLSCFPSLLLIASLYGVVSEPSVAQDAVAQDGVVQDAVAQDAVTQDAVVQDAVVQDAVAQDAVAQDAVAKSENAAFNADPLNSPHPVPWDWVLTTHAQARAQNQLGVRYYRSPALMSPNGDYAAYSRIQLHLEPELYQSQVSSIMFLENLKTGSLQMVAAASTFAENLLMTPDRQFKPGTIALLIPISWTEGSDRVLAREFEGFFSSSDISDYAVVWDRNTQATYILAPALSQYSTAVLLGWSKNNPHQILFRAGTFGDEPWPLWSVDLQGQTEFAETDEPFVVGTQVSNLLSGPQAYYVSQ